jgi:hypothetical protein
MFVLQRLSPSLEYDIPIQLQSITINLVSTTTITLGVDHKSWTTSQNLLQLTDLKRAVTNTQANDLLSEPNSTTLQHIAIPNITPSFTTCTIRHEHSLELAAGFSLEKHFQSMVYPVLSTWDAVYDADSRFLISS